MLGGLDDGAACVRGAAARVTALLVAILGPLLDSVGTSKSYGKPVAARLRGVQRSAGVAGPLDELYYPVTLQVMSVGEMRAALDRGGTSRP